MPESLNLSEATLEELKNLESRIQSEICKRVGATNVYIETGEWSISGGSLYWEDGGVGYSAVIREMYPNNGAYQVFYLDHQQGDYFSTMAVCNFKQLDFGIFEERYR